MYDAVGLQVLYNENFAMFSVSYFDFFFFFFFFLYIFWSR